MKGYHLAASLLRLHLSTGICSLSTSYTVNMKIQDLLIALELVLLEVVVLVDLKLESSHFQTKPPIRLLYIMVFFRGRSVFPRMREAIRDAL